MNQFLKKIFFLLALITIIIACEKDDSPTQNTQNSNSNGAIINEEGNINVAALQRVNPNFKLEHLMENGAFAIELLNDFQYKSLTIEIVSVKGFEPSDVSKQNLLKFIDDRLNKPGGVKVVEKSIDSPGIESYDVQSVFGEIEAKHRTQFNSGTDLAIFIFFADQDDKKSDFSSNMSSVNIAMYLFVLWKLLLA